MKAKTKNMKLRLKEYSFQQNKHGYMLIAPAVIAIILLSIYPLLQGICISFLNYEYDESKQRNLWNLSRTKKLSGNLQQFQIPECSSKLGCLDSG